MASAVNSLPDDFDGTFEYFSDPLTASIGNQRAGSGSNIPAEDGGRSASRSQRIAGLLNQTLGDLHIGDLEEANVQRVLSERLTASGLRVEAAELSDLVLQLHLRLRDGDEVR